MLPNICFFLFFLVASSYSEYTYRTEYIEVPLDHFSYSNNLTFPLRYLVNDSYWRKENGPIFFYTGCEYEIEYFARISGFLWESAIKLNALVVFAEHRYYGQSLPFGNWSLSEPKYFGYLTSEQALADFVDVIYHIRYAKGNNQSKKYIANPVIAFGGSYGGMLSAWMRMKYPFVIEGALASSAPIWLFPEITDCNALFDTEAAIFNKTSQKCVDNIRKSWDVVKNFTSTEGGRKWINKKWKLCNPIKTEENGSALIDWLHSIYFAVSTSNKPYAVEAPLLPLPANPVKKMCAYLNHSINSHEELLSSLFEAISIYSNHTGGNNCTMWDVLVVHPSTIAWEIQACTEMVMPLCSRGITSKHSEWTFESHSAYCFEKYQVLPRRHAIEKMYGGKDIGTASNIIFSNGLLDPWISGGVLHSVSPSTVTVLIPETSHQTDLFASNKNDPTGLVKARKQYIKLFQKWIHNYYSRHNISHSKRHT